MSVYFHHSGQNNHIKYIIHSLLSVQQCLKIAAVTFKLNNLYLMHYGQFLHANSFTTGLEFNRWLTLQFGKKRKFSEPDSCLHKGAFTLTYQ